VLATLQIRQVMAHGDSVAFVRDLDGHKIEAMCFSEAAG
jgi:hypothetical protein